MKPFSFSEFNKEFNIFRWPHPDIRQTYWTKDDTTWDYQEQRTVTKTFTLSTIWYNDVRVIQFYTNDENNGSRKLSAYQVHRENAKAVGLTTHQSYRCNASTIMDALYYRVNAPNYYNKNGTLKKGFWGALVRRLRSNALRSSWVTQHMLQEGIRIAQANYPGGDYEDLEDFLDSKKVPLWSFYRDFLTHEFHIDGEQRQVKLGTNSWVKLHKNTDPREYGYSYDERNDIWLKPEQFYHDGNVYNRDEVDIVRCTQCERETISELCIDGVCHHCLDASFKIHNYSTRVESML